MKFIVGLLTGLGLGVAGAVAYSVTTGRDLRDEYAQLRGDIDNRDFEALGNRLEQRFNELQTTFQERANQVQNAASSNGDAGEAVDKAKSAAGDAIDDAKKAVGDAGDAVSDAASDAASESEGQTATRGRAAAPSCRERASRRICCSVCPTHLTRGAVRWTHILDLGCAAPAEAVRSAHTLRGADHGCRPCAPDAQDRRI